MNLRPAEPVRSYGTAHGRKGNPAAGFLMYIRCIAPPLFVIIPHSDQMKKPAVIRRPQALFEIRSFLHTGAAKRKLISKEQGTAALIAHFRALCYHAGRNGKPQAARLFFSGGKVRYESSRNIIARFQPAVPLWDRQFFRKRKACDPPDPESRTAFLADSPSGSDRIRGFSLPVFFRFRGKSLFH